MSHFHEILLFIIIIQFKINISTYIAIYFCEETANITLQTIMNNLVWITLYNQDINTCFKDGQVWIEYDSNNSTITKDYYII